jgi:hypothetical protein
MNVQKLAQGNSKEIPTGWHEVKVEQRMQPAAIVRTTSDQ